MAKKMSYSEIRKKVLLKIKPTKKEKIKFEKSSQKIIMLIETLLKKNNLQAKVSLGGSVAKYTQLKNAKDIDIFIRYPPIPYSHKDISDITYNALKNKFKPKRIHATRDYFHIEYNKILFEIIPVIEVENASLQHRIMDASPHHVTYVREKLKNTDEVRILKQFFKAQKMYGAESHIRGFSGYVCELLIVRYGTFRNLIANCKKWDSQGKYIDIENHYDSKESSLEVISAGIQTPLIIIDPVQSNRNASASIDEKTYRKFKSVCEIFHNNPSIKAFQEPLIKYEGSGILITIKVNKKNDDTIAARLRSLHDRLVRELAEFIVTGEEWDYDENKRIWQSRIWIGTFLLPKLEEIQGPPLILNSSVKAFKKKHKRTIERDSRIYAIENRKIRTPESKIREVVKESKHYPKGLSIKTERREKL